jgi:hypothetical protein
VFGAALVTLASCSSAPAVDPPGRQLAPDAAGVRVEATLSPHRTVVLTGAPGDATSLPAAESCPAALRSLLTDSGAVADAGLLHLTVRAERRAQVRVERVTARVVTESAAPFPAWARCGTSDWRERNTDDGERYGAQQDVVIEEVSHGVPWITGAGLLSGVEYDGYFEGPPYLADTPFDLSPEVSRTLPMYLANPDPSVRQGFLVNVYLTVNGKQYATTVTDAGGAPFWIYGTGATDKDVPAVEFLEDTRRWVPGRAFDQGDVAERPVPADRTCQVLAAGELKALLGEPVWVDGGSGGCSWTNPRTDARLSLTLTTEKTEEAAVESFRNRTAALPVTYPDARLTHVADVGDEAVKISGFVLAHQGTEYAEFSVSEGLPDRRYLDAAQTAARRLWPVPSPGGGEIAPYVGEWHVHGETLTVRADGTAETVWNAGPCSDAMTETRMCSGRAVLDLTVRPHFAIATTATVSYQDDSGQPVEGFDPGPGGPAAGDTAYLHHVRENVLLSLGDRDGRDGNPYLCGPGVTDSFWTTRCGG